jgi:hypothetical protein
MWWAWFVPCPFTTFLVMLLATGQWCHHLPIHSGGGDIPNYVDRPATMNLKKLKFISEIMV